MKALGALACLILMSPLDSSASVQRAVVRRDRLRNLACFENDYRYPLQYAVGRFSTGSVQCTGFLLNSHNGILTSAACAPAFWSKTTPSGVFELQGGHALQCDGDDRPWPGLSFPTVVERVDTSLGVMLVRGFAGMNTAGGQPPSGYEMGVNLAAHEPENGAEVILVGYQDRLKKIDPSCAAGAWYGGFGVHTCGSAQDITLAGSPIYLAGEDPRYFLRPVIGVNLGPHPSDPRKSQVVSIAKLIESGFLAGEVDEVWH